MENLESELSVLRAKLLEARLLLKKAGDMLEIQGKQKARALRFQILNYLRGSEDEDHQA